MLKGAKNLSFKKLSSPHTHTLGMPMILFPKLHGKIENKMYWNFIMKVLLFDWLKSMNQPEWVQKSKCINK